jgi:hypothetical protein
MGVLRGIRGTRERGYGVSSVSMTVDWAIVQDFTVETGQIEAIHGDRFQLR